MMGWSMAVKKKQEEKDRDLEDYGRQIWLAGLGAYTRLGKEGGKLFEALISEGEEAEKLASKTSLDGAKRKVEKARKKLVDKLSGLEERFDKGVQGATERMGLASQADLQALAARVDQLTSLVEKLSPAPAPAAKPATKAPSSRAKAAAPAEADTAKASKPAGKPAARSAARKTAADTPVAKTAPRRRSTAPKAATRGKTSPAPATDATPGKAPEL